MAEPFGVYEGGAEHVFFLEGEILYFKIGRSVSVKYFQLTYA